MRSLLLFLLLVCVPLVAAAQDAARAQETPKCNLTLEDAPVILGLKLGMGPGESSAAVGRTVRPSEIRSKIRNSTTKSDGTVVVTEKSTWDFIGEREFSYYPNPDTNVGSIYLRFWKHKLFTVLLDFDHRDFVDPSGSDLVAVSKRLELPNDVWKDNRLTCDGFYISVVRRDKSIQVELTDSLAKDEIKKLAEESIAREGHLLSVPASSDVEAKPTLKRRNRP